MIKLRPQRSMVKGNAMLVWQGCGDVQHVVISHNVKKCPALVLTASYGSEPEPPLISHELKPELAPMCKLPQPHPSISICRLDPDPSPWSAICCPDVPNIMQTLLTSTSLSQCQVTVSESPCKLRQLTRFRESRDLLQPY
jgi:hypothetical protein